MKRRPARVKTVQPAERSIALDFDGVIHAYSRGWFTKDIYDPPMVGAYEALKTLSATYGVFILSARPAKEILRWCRGQFPDLPFELVPAKVRYWDRVGVIGVTNRKLPALAYVDDRGLRFTTWTDIVNYFR